MAYGHIVKIFVCITAVLCQRYDRLYKDLMRRDTGKTIPLRSDKDTLNVTVSLALTQVTSIDVESGNAELEGWLYFAWTDRRLAWEPKRYNSVRTIHIPLSNVWIPDIMLYNGHTSGPIVNAIVNNDGGTFIMPLTIIKTQCNISDYNMDGSVFCKLKFGSWTYDGFKINLVMTSSDVDVSSYHSHRWEVVTARGERHVLFYSCCVEPYPDITFTIHFRDVKKLPPQFRWNIF